MQKLAGEFPADSRGAEKGARKRNPHSKNNLWGVDCSRPATAEQRVRQLGIKLPTPPEPFGIYAEAVQTGNLLFLTGMLPTAGRQAKFIRRICAPAHLGARRPARALTNVRALPSGASPTLTAD